jgi:hypothetical protein
MSAINGFFGSVGLAWGLKGLLAKPYGPPGPGDMPPPEPVDGETPPPLQQSMPTSQPPVGTTDAPTDGQPPMDG